MTEYDRLLDDITQLLMEHAPIAMCEPDVRQRAASVLYPVVKLVLEWGEMEEERTAYPDD